MKYLIKRNGRYYYTRRVPEIVKEFDPRTLIRVSLKTDSKEIARQRGTAFNDRMESYWKELVNTGQTHNDKRFKQAVRVARQKGFSYVPASILASGSLAPLATRILASEGQTVRQTEAYLGGVAIPQETVQSALEKFWEISKHRTMQKTQDQLRKWENPRKKAVRNFIKIAGNKNLLDISRDDIIAFRDAWITEIKENGKNPSSANKDLIHLKNVLETVSDHLKIELNITHLFKKIMFKERFNQSRLPLDTKHILAILNSPRLSGLNDEARWFLSAACETGARPSEIVGLLPEDIKLDADIPHICIVDRKDRPLKTPHSQREIPLVGFALDAFNACPNGFARYRDKPDNLTNMLNKFLRENDLFPSDMHSLYSLRHSFQDRILSIDMPDRIQAELMGHKFKRPSYGDGGTLEHKKKWLDKITIKKLANY